jgi:hypothetical protein
LPRQIFVNGASAPAARKLHCPRSSVFNNDRSFAGVNAIAAEVSDSKMVPERQNGAYFNVISVNPETSHFR